MPSGPSLAYPVLVWAAAVLAACLEVIMAWVPAIFCPSSCPRLHPTQSQVTDKGMASCLFFLEDEKSPQAGQKKPGVEGWDGQLANKDETCLYFLLCLPSAPPPLPVFAKAARCSRAEPAGHVGYQEMEAEEGFI